MRFAFGISLATFCFVIFEYFVRYVYTYIHILKQSYEDSTLKCMVILQSLELNKKSNGRFYNL